MAYRLRHLVVFLFCNSVRAFDKSPGPPYVLSALHRISGRLHLAHAMQALIESAPKGSVIVDVGMAHGRESFQAAQAGYHVVGFEANPITADDLIQRASLENFEPGSLKVNHAAVGRANGTTTFYIDRENAYGVGSSLQRSGSKEEVVVPVVSLDDYFALTTENIFLLKTDTQGYENAVLGGSENLFQQKRIQFVIVEMAPFLFPRDEAPENVAEVLYKHGFVCFDLLWHSAGGSRPGAPVNNRANSIYPLIRTMHSVSKMENEMYFTDFLCELADSGDLSLLTP